MVLEKTLESPLDCKEVQPVHPKGDQSWVFIGRTGVEAEAEYIMRNAGLEEAQAGIRIARRNNSNFRYEDDTTLMAESEEE